MEQLEGQYSIFDFEPDDKTEDRDGKTRTAPSWYSYKRCENCQCWARYQKEEQPPAGWGIYGWCTENKHKVEKTSYCGWFDDKNKIM